VTEGQELALEQLRAVEGVAGGHFEVHGTRPAQAADWVYMDVSLACGGLKRAAAGLSLRTREPFSICVPPDFPFRPPAVYTPHRRFAGFPHVQWGNSLCLYAAPSVEWDVSDGMFGFVDRLMRWLEAAAIDELDPIGAPLHPPVTYTRRGPGHAIVVRANTPGVPAGGWFGTAHLRHVSGSRVDLVGWSGLLAPDTPQGVAAALLTTQPMPFEFPDKLADLLTVLEDRNISRHLVFLALRAAALYNENGSPLYVVIGTPMRGIRGSSDVRQHLLVWYIESTIADGLRASLAQFSRDPELRDIGDKVMALIKTWAESAPVAWCSVYEQRPEVTVRRDHVSKMSAFRGKTISLWGCGALGANVALLLARAGVGKLVLRDSSIVTPGILVRQPFEDLHIGRPKVEALKELLLRIEPSLEVDVYAEDLLRSPLSTPEWTDGADAIIETTAAQGVQAKLEQRRRQAEGDVPLILSMAIDAEAEAGLLAVVRPENTGGPMDAVRAAKLAALGRTGLARYVNAFWPSDSRPRFFPEPGCSSPTFIGSAADLTGLASAMLNVAAHELSASSPPTARAHFLARPEADTELIPARPTVDVPAATVIGDPESGYEVRIADAAWKEIRGWISRSRRMVGDRVETGGVLFGERDDSLRVVWIDEILGPPPDSEASELGFVCGTAGVADAAREKATRSRDSLKCVGLWHTHPGGLPIPSTTDFRGMSQVVASTDPSTPKALMLIVGAGEPRYLLAGKVFSREEFQSETARTRLQLQSVDVAARSDNRPRIGLALSGGGARAIAFHLGCLRALHDRGVLEDVGAISAVSGGSVIAGMYAYSQESFAEFDRRVVKLLRRGLAVGIARRAFASPLLVGALGTATIAGSAALIADATRAALTTGAGVLGPLKRKAAVAASRIQPPLRRWISRTTALERTLHDEVFGDLDLKSPRRPGAEVVFNACELRSGSAFRFGSRESGCWRYGHLRDNRVPLSQAIAASAAYPIMLPALDLELDFVSRDGNEAKHRVLLTDGGVYDNLGSSCLEPDRLEKYSYNVLPMDYIICCDAGHGLFDTQAIPFWWGPRVARAFQSVFRKAHDAGHDRLHRLAASGALKGFVLAYLGQQDQKLPHVPADLVSREAVYGYPTDFAPMTTADLERLANRGERLTRLLVDRYCPEV
jgi:predicted acylesterase/phospholipase RssA/proteasome lid subunit RPN8/RPN11